MAGIVRCLSCDEMVIDVSLGKETAMKMVRDCAVLL